MEKGKTENERSEQSKGKKVTGIIACMIFIPIIIINLILIFNSFTNKNDMPEVFGKKPAIVLSGSMTPTFNAGDMILIEKVKDPAALEKGDVICYLISGKATTHRIIQVAEKDGQVAYITKGDYNNVEDRLAVMPDQIQGIYKGTRIPKLGNFLMFAQSSQGMLICLGGPFALYVLYDLVKRREETSKNEANLKSEKQRLEEELAKLKAQSEQNSES